MRHNGTGTFARDVAQRTTNLDVLAIKAQLAYSVYITVATFWILSFHCIRAYLRYDPFDFLPLSCMYQQHAYQGNSWDQLTKLVVCKYEGYFLYSS
jgi:hypothetical protein